MPDEKPTRLLLAVHTRELKRALFLALAAKPSLRIVATADNTAELLTYSRTLQPDGIVLEWELPGRSMDEVFPQLTALNAAGQIFVINKPSSDEHMRELAAQASCFEDPESLVATLESVRVRQTSDESGARLFFCSVPLPPCTLLTLSSVGVTISSISLGEAFIALFHRHGTSQSPARLHRHDQECDVPVRKQMARRIAIVAGCGRCGPLHTGRRPCSRFFIFPSARVNIIGGIILLLLAVKMVMGGGGGDHGGGEAVDPMSIAVSPLAIPLTLNPVGIVTLVVASSQVEGDARVPSPSWS